MKNKVDLGVVADMIASRLEAVRAEEAQVRGGDPAAVHRMRVASRRLRAALVYFRDILPPKDNRLWRRTASDIGRALGPVRQADVQARYLARALKTRLDPGVRAGIKELCALIAAGRSADREKLGIVLDGPESGRNLDELAACLRDFPRDKTLSLKGRKGARVKARIIDRLEAIRELEALVIEPRFRDELHRLRVTVKKLRYELEIHDRLGPKRFESRIELLRQIQEELGRVCEADAWLELLGGLVKERRNSPALEKACLFISTRISASRVSAHVRVMRALREERLRDTWQKLEKEAGKAYD